MFSVAKRPADKVQPFNFTLSKKSDKTFSSGPMHLQSRAAIHQGAWAGLGGLLGCLVV
jgi:hypothetical protein